MTMMVWPSWPSSKRSGWPWCCRCGWERKIRSRIVKNILFLKKSFKACSPLSRAKKIRKGLPARTWTFCSLCLIIFWVFLKIFPCQPSLSGADGKKALIAGLWIYYLYICVSWNPKFCGILLDYFEENRVLLFFKGIFRPKNVNSGTFWPDISGTVGLC